MRGQDYTATNGTSVGALTALVASDVVEVFAYVPFNIANALTVSTVDAKGDLLVGTGADAVGRLAVGTNNQLLAADSSTGSGLKWANPGLTLIYSSPYFSGVPSVSLPTNTFSSTYRNYRIIFWFQPTTNLTYLQWRARKAGTDNATSNYYYSGISTVHSSATISNIRATAATAALTNSDMSNNAPNLLVMDLTDINNSLNPKGNVQLTHSGMGHYAFGWYLAVGDTFDSLTFAINSGNISGRVQVFGVNE